MYLSLNFDLLLSINSITWFVWLLHKCQLLMTGKLLRFSDFRPVFVNYQMLVNRSEGLAINISPKSSSISLVFKMILELFRIKYVVKSVDYGDDNML